MCTVLLPPGDNPIVVKQIYQYINTSCHSNLTDLTDLKQKGYETENTENKTEYYKNTQTCNKYSLNIPLVSSVLLRNILCVEVDNCGYEVLSHCN